MAVGRHYRRRRPSVGSDRRLLLHAQQQSESSINHRCLRTSSKFCSVVLQCVSALFVYIMPCSTFFASCTIYKICVLLLGMFVQYTHQIKQ